MMHFTEGNLLDAKVEAVVNTVNTVGVMGKGIALMFKERFPKNYREYVDAARVGSIQIGKMFVSATDELTGPKLVINFPTKKHWRYPTKIEWIRDGLVDLNRVIRDSHISSIAIPPLGCGNGGLNWSDVRPLIQEYLSDLEDVEIIVYEPIQQYQNVAKKKGVEKLTPARALIAEMIRRYWVLGMECTLLEAQKLAWFLERVITKMGLDDPLDLRFTADRYGPYANRLMHLLDGLDGSFLHCDKRIADAGPFDTIWFDDSKRDKLELYLKSTDANVYLPAIEATDELIDGFQSPLGLEALATVDWLIEREHTEASLEGVRTGIRNWPGDPHHGERKERLFSTRLLQLSLERLKSLNNN